MDEFYIPPARTTRQLGSVNQQSLSKACVGVHGEGDLGDFLVATLRGLSVGGIIYSGGKQGFFEKLNPDSESLAREMYPGQSYVERSDVDTCTHVIGRERPDGFSGTFIRIPGNLSSLEAGVVAGLAGKQLVNLCDNKTAFTGTYLPLEGEGCGYAALVVGAGATGTFTGLQAALNGFTRVDFVDGDKVEVHNLNRQILHYDRVRQNKAVSLRDKARLFGVESEAFPEYLVDDSLCRGYDVVFSCVDKKLPRRILDAASQELGFLLVDGGTSISSGRVMNNGKKSLGEQVNLLGDDKNDTSCAAQANPSIIMPNMIIGSYMVDEALHILGGRQGRTIHYDSFANEVFYGSE